MRRREFIGLLGGAAVAWPCSATAQESGRVPLIGWLVGQEESDTVSSSERAALREGLAASAARDVFGESDHLGRRPAFL